jgi:hypothetical protein
MLAQPSDFQMVIAVAIGATGLGLRFPQAVTFIYGRR